MLSVDDLLAGPRGRRVCLELAGPPGPTSLDVSAESVSLALTASVDAARYWQAPDEWDRALAAPSALDALRPVAELLVASSATSWWTAPLDVDDLHEVEMLDDEAPSARAPLTDVAGRLSRWRAEHTEEEAQHVGSDRGLEHAIGGAWWSTPTGASPVVTSPTVPSLGPAGLSYPEDSFGWSRARTWRLSARQPVRTYEVDGPDDLARLVARFPLDVSRSRRGCWWETTGVDTAWAMPDWEAASHELDAVHLTVRGYLTTAGRAVTVPGGVITSTSTVLAGWTPGETIWLTDVLTPAGPPVTWERRDDEVLWDAVPDATDPEEAGRTA